MYSKLLFYLVSLTIIAVAMTNEFLFAKMRNSMIRSQIIQRGIDSPQIIDAMMSVPRHKFVPDFMINAAYDDTPLPIGYGQTISQPFIVARMLEAADVNRDDNVLEVGTGCGYAAAVISRIAKNVYSSEIIPELGEMAKKTIDQLGYNNVHLSIGDGVLLRQDNGPFQVILVACAAKDIPSDLRDKLSVGGRMIIPVGEESRQSLIKVTRVSENDFREEELEPVMFVPLTSRSQP